MSATRWQPFTQMYSELNRVRDEMDRLFGRYTGNGGAFAPAHYPALNLWEDDDQLFVEAELPGMELSDLEIFVHGGKQLAITGERQQPSDEASTWHRQERGSGRFSRTVDLPTFVESDKVEAELKHGVLTIRLPKREEAKPRRIEVKTS